MGYRYAVLGAGRQGTAAAYDMVRFGDADSVLLADNDQERAEAAARRVNELTHTQKARASRIDVRDEAATVKLLAGTHLRALGRALRLQPRSDQGRDRGGRELLRPRRQHRRRARAAQARRAGQGEEGLDRPRLRPGSRPRERHGRLREAPARQVPPHFHEVRRPAADASPAARLQARLPYRWIDERILRQSARAPARARSSASTRSPSSRRSIFPRPSAAARHSSRRAAPRPSP